MSTRLVDLLITNTPPGDILRATAARMREQAEAVPQDWRLIRTQIVAVGTDRLAGTDVIATCMVPERAAYVVSQQPAVALMVARLLEELAGHADHGRQGALVQDGVDICRAYMLATGWRPEHEMTGAQR